MTNKHTRPLTPQAQEFRSFVESILTNERLPETEVNGSMGRFTAAAQELAHQFEAGGEAAFTTSLATLLKADTAANVALADVPLLTQKKQPHGMLMSTVTYKPIRWLWPGRLALGKLHMFDGDGGIGKGILMCDLIARLTRGHPMPYEDRAYYCGGAVIVGMEEDNQDTLQPRLARAGTDLSRVLSLGELTDYDSDGHPFTRLFSYPADLPILEAAIAQVNVLLIVFDPITGLLSETYKDNEVRQQLSSLRLIAEKYDVAIVLIRHITKSHGDNLKHWGGGSVAFTNLARIGLMAMVNPDDDDQCIFATIKTNLNSKKVPKLLYTIVSSEEDERPHIKWEGETQVSDSDLAKAPSKNTGSVRLEILRTLSECKPVAKTVQEVAEALPDATLNNVRVTLKRMYDRREIGKSARDAYYAL